MPKETKTGESGRLTAPRSHRLSWAPSAIIDMFDLPDSPIYTQCLTLSCPDDFYAVRVGLPNVSTSPYRIERLIGRASGTWNDYVNPTGDAPWRSFTFAHGGRDEDSVVTSPDSPTSAEIAPRDIDLSTGETYIPRWTWTDWCPLRSLDRTDTANGPRVLMLRMLLPQGQRITFASSGFLGYTGELNLHCGFDYATAKWHGDVVSDPLDIDAAHAAIGHGINSMACVQFLTAREGVTGIVTGDSHHAGTTTTSQLTSFGLRAMVALGSANVGRVPLGYVTCATGGSKSQQFFPRLFSHLSAVRPGFVVLPGWTYNDEVRGVHAGAEACSIFFARLLQAIDLCKAVGAVPIILTPFPRDPESMGAAQLIPWRRLRNDVLAFRTSGKIVLDTTSILGRMRDGMFDGTYLPEFTTDQVHPNDAGHQAVADRLIPTLRNLCGLG